MCSLKEMVSGRADCGSDVAVREASSAGATFVADAVLFFFRHELAMSTAVNKKPT
jgi:hypothetical protein